MTYPLPLRRWPVATVAQQIGTVQPELTIGIAALGLGVVALFVRCITIG